MHDWILAKEIIDEVLKIAEKKKLANIKGVELEIGSVFLAHDGYPKHTKDISLENLKFGLKNIAKNTLLENVKFNIKKVPEKNWKITGIKVE